MKNSFVKKYLIFLLLLFILFVGFVFINNKNKSSQSQNTVQESSANKTYETKTDTQGTIEVEVTPKVLSSNRNSSFDVGINNHQVNLNYDLAKIAVLTDDKGNKYTAISWSGPEGGHHSVGVLAFPPLSKAAGSVSLLLPKIEGVDRSFTWKL